MRWSMWPRGRWFVRINHVAMADRARDARRWGMAAQHYHRALRRDPRNAPIWVQYGHSLKEAGRIVAAEEAYRKAIQLEPDIADLHVQLGHALKLQGRQADAEAAYVHACTLDRDMFETSPDVRAAVEKSSDEKTIAHEFDRAYYLRTYPDVDPALVDPLEHFCIFGWKDGRNPCAWFSTRFYLNAYRDVAAANVNPFAHYLKRGRAERRMTGASSHARQVRIDRPALPVIDELLLDFLRFPTRPLIPAATGFDPKQLDIHWVIPDFTPGSGGHMNIFRIVRWLEIFGHHCTIWIYQPSSHSTAAEALSDIIKHFQTVRSRVRFVEEGLLYSSGDVVIATGWQTAQVVCHAQKFKERFYFVQDFEPAFFPRGAYSLLIKSSYRQDIACICGGSWLEKLMRERYGRWARVFWQAADNAIYFPAERRPGNPLPRIAFYSRIGTARRAVQLGLLALQHLAAQGGSFHVDLFGDDLALDSAPFSCAVHGVLDAEELAELYRSADIGLCFSTTNYSIVPQEMMACGLPIVEIDVESTRAIFPEDVVAFCPPEPHAIAETVGALLGDPERRRRQADAARAWVGQFSWEKSGRLVEAALCERLRQRGHRATSTAGENRKVSTTPKASVFIPTFNGGELFLKVIERVRTQRCPWPFEIVVIDSSSTDGTGEFSRAAGDIVFEQIPKSEFSHGGTRNRGVALAKGEFVAFLTQDALPADEFWLYNLVSLLELYPDAGGAFGRHLAWPDASPFTKRDLRNHFRGFDFGPVAVSNATDPERWAAGDVGWRQFLHFYSDNNSCLRRSVWDRFPLPPVEFGEDQLWADRIIAAGYQKLYAASAVVYHSHDYEYEEARNRAEVEATFYKKEFGYDLITSETQLQTALADCNESDARWAAKSGIDEPCLQRRLAANKARLEGYLAAHRQSPS